MMIENKRFRKVRGFIQDNTCEGGDVNGVMDLTEIEGMLNSLNDEKEHWKYNCIKRVSEYSKVVNENELFSRDEIKEILQKHKNHLIECESYDEPTSYWKGACDCVEYFAEAFGVIIK